MSMVLDRDTTTWANVPSNLSPPSSHTVPVMQPDAALRAHELKTAYRSKLDALKEDEDEPLEVSSEALEAFMKTLDSIVDSLAKICYQDRESNPNVFIGADDDGRIEGVLTFKGKRGRISLFVEPDGQLANLVVVDGDEVKVIPWPIPK